MYVRLASSVRTCVQIYIFEANGLKGRGRQNILQIHDSGRGLKCFHLQMHGENEELRNQGPIIL